MVDRGQKKLLNSGKFTTTENENLWAKRMTKKSFSQLSDGAEIVFQLFRDCKTSNIVIIIAACIREKRITTLCYIIGTHKFPTCRDLSQLTFPSVP